MATPDVSKMSFAELQKLVQEAQARLSEKRDEEIKVLADGYAKKCEMAGFSIQEAIAALEPYLPTKQKRAPRKVSEPVQRVRYRDPANSDNTWSGRGRPARWLQEYLNKGAKKEEFLVPEAQA